MKIDKILQLISSNHKFQHLYMFCCFTGNKKGEGDAPKELAVNLKNKRPQDFMKDPIPLSLSQNITFQLGKDKKWTTQISASQRAQKRQDDGSLTLKIQENEKKLIEARQKEAQLDRLVESQRKIQQELSLQLARKELNARGIEFMIASETRQIYKYQEKVRPNQS